MSIYLLCIEQIELFFALTDRFYWMRILAYSAWIRKDEIERLLIWIFNRYSILSEILFNKFCDNLSNTSVILIFTADIHRRNHLNEIVFKCSWVGNLEFCSKSMIYPV